MACHQDFTRQTLIPVYVCELASPWQRGSNENTNGLLRQYFPKGTDLGVQSPEHLTRVAAELRRDRSRLPVTHRGIGATGKVMPAYYLLIGAAALGLISVSSSREPVRRPVNGSLPNVETEAEARRLMETQDAEDLIDPEDMPLPYFAFRRSTDDELTVLSLDDPEVQLAARGAHVRIDFSTVDVSRPCRG